MSPEHENNNLSGGYSFIMDFSQTRNPQNLRRQHNSFDLFLWAEHAFESSPRQGVCNHTKSPVSELLRLPSCQKCTVGWFALHFPKNAFENKASGSPTMELQPNRPTSSYFCHEHISPETISRKRVS